MSLKHNLEFSVTVGDQVYGSDIEPVQTEAGLVFVQEDKLFVVVEGKIRETCKELYSDDSRMVPKTNSPFALEVRRDDRGIRELVVSRISSDMEPVLLGQFIKWGYASDWWLVRQEEHYVFIRQGKWLDRDLIGADWFAFKLSEEQSSEK
jgi:hypothetical protein